MINSFYRGNKKTCRIIKNTERRLAKRNREKVRQASVRRNHAPPLNKWGKPFYKKEVKVVEWEFHPWNERGRQGFWYHPKSHEKLYGDRDEPPLSKEYHVWRSTVPFGEITYKIPMKIRYKRGFEEK